MSDRKHNAGLRRAIALRQQFRAWGEFSQAAFEDALREALREFEAEAFDAYVKHVARLVDRCVTRDRPSQQPFLPGAGASASGALSI